MDLVPGWGGRILSFIFAKRTLDDLPPITQATGRCDGRMR
jgi:hypothetical protein